MQQKDLVFITVNLECEIRIEREWHGLSMIFSSSVCRAAEGRFHLLQNCLCARVFTCDFNPRHNDLWYSPIVHLKHLVFWDRFKCFDSFRETTGNAYQCS